ncbi:MAG: hypothetical protein Q7T55_15425, partial [Solirubrobacteraceae bacterium]|nr:hypothetical protein [Solirubrobacteraceae bacterium]
TATATAWIADLHVARQGEAKPKRAATVATAANIGGLGLGPLVGGILAQWVDAPLTTPYVVALVAMAIGFVAVAVTPETTAAIDPKPAYRPQRVAVPAEARGIFFFAALGTAIAFAALGLFSSLAPSFIAGELHHTSRALAGAAAFIVFTSAALTQTLAASWAPRRQLQRGTAAMVVGPLLLVVSVWLPSPSLALFLVGGAVSGMATGLLFKGALGTVAAVAPADRRAEALSGIFLAGYLGLTVPVVGLGILTQVVAADVSLTLFAALLTIGALVAARPVLRPAPKARELATA